MIVELAIVLVLSEPSALLEEGCSRPPSRESLGPETRLIVPERDSPVETYDHPCCE